MSQNKFVFLKTLHSRVYLSLRSHWSTWIDAAYQHRFTFNM